MYFWFQIELYIYMYNYMKYEIQEPLHNRTVGVQLSQPHCLFLIVHGKNNYMQHVHNVYEALNLD